MATKLKLAVIGDPHIAIPYGDPDPRLEIDPGRKLHGLSVELIHATVDEINAAGDIDAAIVLGDLTRDSELFNHDVARAELARLRMPFYIVRGNHDNQHKRPKGVSYPDEPHLDKRGFVNFYRDAGLPGDSTRYAVELPGGVVLIVLDSNWSLKQLKQKQGNVKLQDHGWVSKSQRLWLDDMLSNVRSGGRLPLVAVHHTIMAHSPAERKKHILRPFFASWRARGSRKLRRVLAEHRVPLVLSGHIHAQSVNVQDGITNLTTAATVCYPHAWRELIFENDYIQTISHPLETIPSCMTLQDSSRRWLAEGMAAMVQQHSRRIPLLARLSGGLHDFIAGTGWWPRFCDGTLAGFRVDKKTIPNGNPMLKLVYKRISTILNEYGAWKTKRPDPNNLEIPLID